MKQYDGLPDEWLLYTPEDTEEARAALNRVIKLIKPFIFVRGAHYGKPVPKCYYHSNDAPPPHVKIFTPAEFLAFGEDIELTTGEDRKPVMGDVAVRLKGAGGIDAKGRMYTLAIEGFDKDDFRYGRGWSMRKGNWRFATAEEKLAFEGGVTNINDMEVSKPAEASINTYGLSIGYKISKADITEWVAKGYNINYGRAEGWRRERRGLFASGRTIVAFKVIKGVVGVQVSGTSSNVHIRAEGLKEFIDSRKSQACPPDLEVETIMEAYGIRVGDSLDMDAVNKWKNMNENYLNGKHSAWRSDAKHFDFSLTARKVENIIKVGGIHALAVGLSTTYIKAEGFKEFCEGLKSSSDLDVDKPKVGDLVVVIDEGLSVSAKVGDLDRLSCIDLDDPLMRYELERSAGWVMEIRKATFHEKMLYVNGLRTINKDTITRGDTSTDPFYEKVMHSQNARGLLHRDQLVDFCRGATPIGALTSISHTQGKVRRSAMRPEPAKKGHVPLIEVKRR